MATQEVNEFLASAGVPAAKFTNVGDTVKGVIVSAEVRDQTDLKTKAVKHYDDGNAMKQLVITLQTEDQDTEDDDGARRVYAKGAMLAALRQATGQEGIAVGGKLAVRYVGDGQVKQHGFNPPKQYKVFYEAPTQAVGVPYDGDGPPPHEDDDLPF